MIYLLLAICSSAAIAIIMRISAEKVNANLSMLAVNYLVCSLLGGAYAGFRLMPLPETGFPVAIGVGAVNGVLYLVSFILLQISTYKNGIVLSSLFMKLGLLVPIVVSVIFFKEVPTGLQVTGFCIAIAAIILMNLKKDSVAVKGVSFLLILLLLTGGGGDAMAKVFQVFGTKALSNQFLFYTFAVAFVICVCMVLGKRERIGKWEILFGAVIGVPNFFSSKFLLGALRELPAVVVYPTFSVATILVVTLVGVVAFKERLKKLQWIAMVAILAALIMLNV